MTNEAAEKAVCAMLALDGVETYKELVGMDLEPSDFTVPQCRLYFELFGEYAKDHPAATNDEVARCGWLNDKKIGLQDYALATQAHPSPLEGRECARDVKRLSMRRKLAAAAAQVGETAKTNPDGLSGAVFALSKLQILPAKALSFQQLADARAEAVRNPQPEDTLNWIHWPWTAFDSTFKPFMPGELVVIAARPGIGKSSMCRQIAMQAAFSDQPVFYASLEMPASQIFDGMAVQWADQPKDDSVAFLAAAASLRSLPIQIDDSSRSFNAIASGAMKFRNRRGLGLVVIDYLNKLTDCEAQKNETKASAIGRVTSRCKSMAMELGCVVILIAHVNRNPGKEKRDANMGDLKDSSDIEGDADRVILLQNPPSYSIEGGPDETQSLHDTADITPTWYTQVFQDKSRSTGTAAGALIFVRKLAKFSLPHK